MVRKQPSADSQPIAPVTHTNNGKQARRFFNSNFVWAGVGLAASYWVLESLIHVAVFREGTFVSQFLTIDPHEIWKRLLVATLLVLFSLYAQHGMNIRRRTEIALRTSEKKYRTLIEKAHNPVFVFDRTGRFLDFNEAVLQFFESDRNQFTLKTYQDLTTQGDHPSDYSGSLSDQVCGLHEVDFTVNGQNKTLLLNVVPLTTEEHYYPVYYAICQDITDRKQAEHDLELAHAEITQIFQTASSAMRLIDLDFNVLKINQTFADLSGFDEQSAVGTKCYDTFAGDQCHTDSCSLVRVLKNKKAIEGELSRNRIDGSTVSCLLSATPFLDPHGTPIGIVESFKDISELSKTQEELRAERDKLRKILFQQFEGVSILRPDYVIEYQNETLRKEIGDCEGLPCYEAFCGRDQPCETCFMHKAIETESLQRFECNISDGRVFEHTYTPFLDVDSEEKVVVYHRDITEVKTSRAAAIRSEQLAAVGELAAGVAHEINNPINGIINYAQMLINEQLAAQKIKNIGERIVNEGDRVARIVTSLLLFARGGPKRRTAISIEELISESLTLVGAQIRKDWIIIDVEMSPGLPNIECVPQEIQQVFLNILNNARYALNEKYPMNNENKKLRIQATAQGTEKDRLVRVSFHDYGTGIPNEILDKITHPFFSTKPTGMGTGLGLSISHDIIDEHGGNLSIESRDGEFTQINVDLPPVVM